MPVNSTDSAPDISFELGGCSVDGVSEVDLVCQLREGSQKCFDRGVGTSGSNVLGLNLSN